MPQPTLTDIAQHLGISKMTVSRALRGEKHVSAGVREQVSQAAAELNYRPDPEITKLMSHMRRAKHSKARQTLAFVWAEREAGTVTHTCWSQQLVLGARKRAESLGFQLDEFYLDESGMTARRLSEIMEARGIPGFILSPLLSRRRGHVSMAWEKFSSVVIGLGFARPQLHRVHHHHYLGMMNALRMLKKLGYQRVGFYGGSTINERMYRAWSASFLAHHPLPLDQAAALMQLTEDVTQADFQTWLQGAKPDVVIESSHLLADWLKDKDIGHATLGWRADYPQIAGIDQQADVLGAAAVDLLVAQYQNNERGIPEHPKMLMTDGVWRTGKSLKRQLA